MAYTEQDFMEGLEKVAEDTYNWRMSKVAADLNPEKRESLKLEAGFREQPVDPPATKEQGDIGKQAAAMADRLAKAAGIPANIANSPETSAKEKAKILALQQAMQGKSKTAGPLSPIQKALIGGAVAGTGIGTGLNVYLGKRELKKARETLGEKGQEASKHWSVRHPIATSVLGGEFLGRRYTRKGVEKSKTSADKTAQGYDYGGAPGPLARGGGFQAPTRPMPIEPTPGFSVQHPTAVTAGSAAAGGVAGGAAGFGVGKAIEALTGSSSAGMIGAGVGGTLGSILGAAIGSREGEKAEEGYSRELVDYLSKISADKSAGLGFSNLATGGFPTQTTSGGTGAGKGVFNLAKKLVSKKEPLVAKMAAAKKGEKVESDWMMRHPVGAGAAMFGSRHLLNQISKALLRNPKTEALGTALYLGSVQGGARAGSALLSRGIAKKWEKATGKPLSEAPSWWMRHPAAAGALLPSIGLGMTASKTRKALEAKKLLKKTSADKSEKPKSYQMYYGPTPESVKRLQSHERTGKTVGTLGGILAGLPIAARAMRKTPRSALLALGMMGAPVIGGIAGRKGGEYIGKEIGEARTGAKTEKLPFISPGRTLAMAQVAGRKSTIPRELPPSSRFITQPTVAVKSR